MPSRRAAIARSVTQEEPGARRGPRRRRRTGAAGQLRRLPPPVSAAGVAGTQAQLAVEHLERDLAALPEGLGAIHRRGRTPAEFVASGERRSPRGVAALGPYITGMCSGAPEHLTTAVRRD